jgi:hypothetical protein
MWIPPTFVTDVCFMGFDDIAVKVILHKKSIWQEQVLLGTFGWGVAFLSGMGSF